MYVHTWYSLISVKPSIFQLPMRNRCCCPPPMLRKPSTRWWGEASKFRRFPNEKLRRFPNLRFLYFCKVYNVKIVFCHDPGSRKCIKNVSKIHITFDTRKMMQKAWKRHPKRRPGVMKNRWKTLYFPTAAPFFLDLATLTIVWFLRCESHFLIFSLLTFFTKNA